MTLFNCCTMSRDVASLADQLGGTSSTSPTGGWRRGALVSNDRFIRLSGSPTGITISGNSSKGSLKALG
jgi:hypothetical protein